MSDEEYHLQQLEEELDEEIKKEIQEEEYNDLMERYEFDDGDWETFSYKKEYEDLQERIEKAINYIENNSELYYGDELYDEYQKIVDILKGEDND